MKKILALIVLVSLGIMSCNAQQKGAKTGKAKASRVGYKLMVDFVSKGAGIDNAAYTKVEELANNHPKKPAFNVVAKGKEGEKKMYFGLTELNEDEQRAFVEEVQKIVGSSETVAITSKVPQKKLGMGSEAGTQVNASYRLIVSFISKGAGTDGKAHEKFLAYVQNHPKKPVFEEKRWGREGEKDYLFMLKEMNADEQKVFVEEVKKLVSSSDLIILKENEVYVKKGR